MMRIALVVMLCLNGIAATAFVFGGVVRDKRKARRSRELDKVRTQLAQLLLMEQPPSAAQIRSYRRTSRTLMLSSLQSLVFDVTGRARDRALQIVDAFGLDREIRKLARSRNWRKRLRASQLLHLLPSDAAGRKYLLRDPHPLVRAYAIEGLVGRELHSWYEVVLDALDAPERPVQRAAQSALLQSESRSLPQLVAYLSDDTRPGIPRALEAASRIPDHRLQSVLNSRLAAVDDEARVLVARGLGLSATRASAQILGILLEDPSPKVRAQAAASIGHTRGAAHATALGRLLADESWEVRRNAGLALDVLGPVGSLVLRRLLVSDDLFARDMARQVLDAAAIRTHQPAPLSAKELREHELVPR